MKESNIDNRYKTIYYEFKDLDKKGTYNIILKS